MTVGAVGLAILVVLVQLERASPERLAAPTTNIRLFSGYIITNFTFFWWLFSGSILPGNGKKLILNYDDFCTLGHPFIQVNCMGIDHANAAV